MDVKQVLDLIKQGENQEVEFKRKLNSNQEIGKVICSFANTQGGILVLGVEDNGKLVGINEDVDEVQQRLAAASQVVSPTPITQIERHQIQNKVILVTIIQQSPDNTYYTFQGAIYVRIGSTTKRIEGQTHLEFLRNKQILSFDETYEPECQLDDIDTQKVQSYLNIRDQGNYLKKNSLAQFLLNSKLASSNGSLRIKNAVILLFSKNPAEFIPQAEIKLVWFKGIEAVNILAHKIIQEDVPHAIEQSVAFIQKTLSKTINIDDKPTRKEEFEYPLSVIREAIVNAVAHRDYFSKDAVQIYVFDNRIEITNPGSIPGELPEELFGTLSVQRNPLTYRFLRDMGYVEGLGTGIPRMKNAMRSANLQDPVFTFTKSFFRLTLYNQKGKKKPIHSQSDLNERQKKALDYLQKHASIKSKTYAEINNVSQTTAVHDINELCNFGFLEKKGEYRGAYYVINERSA